MLFNALYPAFDDWLVFLATLVLVLVAAYLVNVFIERRYAKYVRKVVLSNIAAFTNFASLVRSNAR